MGKYTVTRIIHRSPRKAKSPLHEIYNGTKDDLAHSLLWLIKSDIIGATVSYTREWQIADKMESYVDRDAQLRRFLGCRHQLTIVANLGLVLSIGLAVASFLPVDWPRVSPFDLKLGSGVAVAFFLDVSFWLAGWSGSALGILLMAIAMIFGAFLGRTLGLVGMALSVLMGVTVVLLILSDWPALSSPSDDERRLRRHLVVGIGLVGNIVVGALVWMMLWRF
jgi:hypothetical protein